jgi:hypothetical protein
VHGFYLNLIVFTTYSIYSAISYIFVLTGYFETSLASKELHASFAAAGVTVSILHICLLCKKDQACRSANSCLTLFQYFSVKYFRKSNTHFVFFAHWETLFQLTVISCTLCQPWIFVLFYLLDPLNKRYPVWLFIKYFGRYFTEQQSQILITLYFLAILAQAVFLIQIGLVLVCCAMYAVYQLRFWSTYISNVGPSPD